MLTQRRNVILSRELEWKGLGDSADDRENLCVSQSRKKRVSMCREEPASRESGKGRSEGTTSRMLLREVRDEDTEDLDLPDSFGPGFPLSLQVSHVTCMSLSNSKVPQVNVLHIWPRQTMGWRVDSVLRSSTFVMLSCA